MLPNLGYYVQTVDKIVKETEAIGETMHPKYEKIREAIDQKKTAELTQAELVETVELFDQGTEKYRNMLKKISTLRPPAKVMGIHKNFEKAYKNYVAGYEEMTQSIQPEKGIDAEQFDASEAKQDQATDDISAAIQKMTNLLMK